jgi:hypothetical protein
MYKTKGREIFQKCTSQLKIVSARGVTLSMFHTEGPQRHHHTKSSRRGDLAWDLCFCAPCCFSNAKDITVRDVVHVLNNINNLHFIPIAVTVCYLHVPA